MNPRFIFLFLCCMMMATALPQNLIIPAPANNGATTGLRAPNGTAGQTTLRAHFIIPASELAAIPTGTVITDLGVNMSSGAIGNATGNLHFHLENTTDVVNNKSVDWSVATAPMSTVYNGSFAIPNAAGPSDFTLTNTFTYNGGGIYVAYEYIGTTFATTGAVYLANNALANSCRTGATGTATPLDSLDGLSAWRPEIRFIFANPYTNNIGVSNIEANFGTVNSFLQDDSEVEVVITNLASSAATSIPVTLTVSGASTYTSTQTISTLASNANTTLTFSNVPASAPGNNLIQVTVPTDQQTSNDTLNYLQLVSCDSVGYSNSAPPTGAVGFNTGAGILAAEYDIPASVPINIKSVDIVVGNNAASVGNVIKGVLLNSSGALVDSSAAYTIAAGDLGQGISLTLLNGNIDYSGQVVFPGIRQSQNAATGYFPLAMQAKINPPIDTYASFGVNGGTPTYQNTLDPFMISMTIEVRPLLVFSNATSQVCTGSPVNIDVFPLAFDDYLIYDGGTLLQTNTGGSFTVNPTVTTTYDVVASTGSCPSPAGSITIQVVSEYNEVLDESICNGETFDFNGQMLTTGGQYVDTLNSLGGCDSIITLNLDLLMPTTATVDEVICDGEVYSFFGSDLTTSGTYTEIIPNSAGCDSTITLNLEIALENVTVSQSGATLTVSVPNATYQWIDCDDNNSPITGATSQSFTPTAVMGITGNYAVQVQLNNCSAISACSQVDFTELDKYSSDNLKVYPNPVRDQLSIKSTVTGLKEYVIYDALGREVQSGSVKQTELIIIDVSNLNFGAYLLELKNKDKTFTRSFIK